MFVETRTIVLMRANAVGDRRVLGQLVWRGLAVDPHVWEESQKPSVSSITAILQGSTVLGREADGGITLTTMSVPTKRG